MKDALGNDLRVGDMVAVQLDRPLIFGRVVAAQDGGMVAAVNAKGEMEVRPGRLLIESAHPIEFDPRHPIRAVVAVRYDAAGAAQEGAPMSSDPKYHFN